MGSVELSPEARSAAFFIHYGIRGRVCSSLKSRSFLNPRLKLAPQSFTGEAETDLAGIGERPARRTKSQPIKSLAGVIKRARPAVRIFGVARSILGRAFLRTFIVRTGPAQPPLGGAFSLRSWPLTSSQRHPGSGAMCSPIWQAAAGATRYAASKQPFGRDYQAVASGHVILFV